MKASNHALVTLLLCLLSWKAQAQWLTWPPSGQTTTTSANVLDSVPYRGDLQSVEMQLQRHAASIEVWVVNPLSGPVEVEVDTGQGRPIRRTIAAQTRNLLDKFDARGAVNAQLRAIPGPLAGRATPFDYGLPVPEKGLRIDQADGGKSSHDNPENLHALDFAAPMGTPVVAARDGLVMQIENQHADAAPGQRAIQGARPNFVRVLHTDGSMALYAHLQQGSVVVQPGQQVGKGELIGRVGNSGQSSAPHLHFVVQTNAGMRLISAHVQIATSQGSLRVAGE
ncbi:M23 family metallopeptidase [Lysobacter soyae]|uniref:M23 family metallopeptidase n=1 Tax=Lysobacter soyae TaxID=2764185 RepID=A0ABX8WRJ6_9GAMM|nr:M23 family metallopeptidase [Lysobacter sp. CJ11]QYR53447.1 M23 family metallopeptidase [Lysobacter sp. CJ11]